MHSLAEEVIQEAEAERSVVDEVMAEVMEEVMEEELHAVATDAIEEASADKVDLGALTDEQCQQLTIPIMEELICEVVHEMATETVAETIIEEEEDMLELMGYNDVVDEMVAEIAMDALADATAEARTADVVAEEQGSDADDTAGAPGSAVERAPADAIYDDMLSDAMLEVAAGVHTDAMADLTKKRKGLRPMPPGFAKQGRNPLGMVEVPIPEGQIAEIESPLDFLKKYCILSPEKRAQQRTVYVWAARLDPCLARSVVFANLPSCHSPSSIAVPSATRHAPAQLRKLSDCCRGGARTAKLLATRPPTPARTHTYTHTSSHRQSPYPPSRPHHLISSLDHFSVPLLLRTRYLSGSTCSIAMALARSTRRSWSPGFGRSTRT